jgi:hypothetical protein
MEQSSILIGAKIGPIGDVFIIYSDFSKYNKYSIVKHGSSDGKVLWESFSDPIFQMEVPFLYIDPENNLILSNNGGPFGDKYIILKLSEKDGSVIWKNTYSQENSELYKPLKMNIDNNGDIYAVGDDDKLRLIKYSGITGEIIFDNYYDKKVKFSAMNIDKDGNIILGGDDIFLKYSAQDGSFLWKRELGVQLSDFAIDSNWHLVCVSKAIGIYQHKLYKFDMEDSGPPGILSTNAYSSVSCMGTFVELNGIINPNGNITSYWIEYGNNNIYNESTESIQLLPLKESKNITETIFPIERKTKYYFRLVASNIQGTISSNNIVLVSSDEKTSCDCYTGQERETCYQARGILNDINDSSSGGCFISLLFSLH